MRRLNIAYFAHSIRSDWNNGNAHFLRGLMRALGKIGYVVTVFEQEHNWSVDNLLQEGERGTDALRAFQQVYADIRIVFYEPSLEKLRVHLDQVDVVIVHEWNTPDLVSLLFTLRAGMRFRMLFHDTHHRASSSPEAIRSLQVPSFDGIIAFGESLREIYRRDFKIPHVWILHEAADVTVFQPRELAKQQDVVWVGNWGDDERSAEIKQFFVQPAERLAPRRFVAHGVRYPREGLEAFARAGICFKGYLANLSAPDVYAASRVTVHIPRQQYLRAMAGIPTIRVFEAMACGIPLVSAPWEDQERLFREDAFLMVRSEAEMAEALDHLCACPQAGQEQAARGLREIRERHTCDHRAIELTNICDEVLAQ